MWIRDRLVTIRGAACEQLVGMCGESGRSCDRLCPCTSDAGRSLLVTLAHQTCEGIEPVSFSRRLQGYETASLVLCPVTRLEVHDVSDWPCTLSPVRDLRPSKDGCGRMTSESVHQLPIGRHVYTSDAAAELTRDDTCGTCMH